MKSRSRTKKVSYVLQVQCIKPPQMNEKEFLAQLRGILFESGIRREGQSAPTVSVIQRTETFLSAKDAGGGAS